MINLIDTIKLRYDIQSSHQYKKLILWIKDNYSESYQITTRTSGLSCHRCKINNLRIYMDYKYIFIEGSLPKFYVGNNTQPLDSDKIFEMFNLLNSKLGFIIDVKLAYIRRLDIGINLIMDHKPIAYISRITSLTCKNPTLYKGETLYLNNNSRGMIIYDKTSEAKKDAKKNKIDVAVPDNLLRLETSIKSKYIFKQKFKSELPRVNQLLQQLNELSEIWLDEYNKLDKDYSYSITTIANQKDLLDYAITATGLEKIKWVIDYSYKLNTLNTQNRYRFTKLVKDAFKKTDNANNNDLMRELDSKVNELFRKHGSHLS